MKDKREKKISDNILIIKKARNLNIKQRAIAKTQSKQTGKTTRTGSARHFV